jgi:hypothetical protein
MKRTAIVAVVGLTVFGVSTVGASGVASAAKPKIPVVKAISPEHGPLSGGTIVEIVGGNFGGVTGVQFGGTASSQVTPVNQHEVLAVAPAGTGTVDVQLTTSVGTSAAVPADQFTYVTTPTIQKVAPRAGTTLGGNRVTISGSGFTGATSVSFGANPAVSFTVQSDQEIVAVTPPGKAGSVGVSVTTPNGSTPADPVAVFTYSLKVPVVTSVAPDVGPASGGTSVTITGTRFTKVSAVDFGSVPAASYTVVDSKSITAVAPPGTGTVDVNVTNASGTSAYNSPVDQFTYTPGD